jgi:UDP-N-acetyl-D-glucosamine dehydrogenase
VKTVGVIGLGYVGLPLSVYMHRAGRRVLGFDIDPQKIAKLSDGECYLKHLEGRFGAGFVGELIDSGRFEPTTDFDRYCECEALLICVPTPLNDERRPELRYVEETTRGIAKRLAGRGEPQLVVLESTTYPGTTRRVLKPILDEAQRPYHLSFSPEREDPGGPWQGERIPKLVGGIDPASREAARALYVDAFDSVVPVGGADGGAEVAEAAKLLENIYRAVNIAVVNETKLAFEAMGINIWEVIEAAATKPFGFAKFTPGPGLGGHCIPIDPYYLTYIAEEHGQQTRMIELAGEINTSMPAYVVERTLEALYQPHADRPLRVLVLGLAYKPDIDDVRESPSFELIRLFREAGCEVEYSDPYVPETHPMRQWGDLGLRSVQLDAEVLASFDAVVVSTAHSAFDWDLIARCASFIVDTRNALAGREVAGRVIRA